MEHNWTSLSLSHLSIIEVLAHSHDLGFRQGEGGLQQGRRLDTHGYKEGVQEGECVGGFSKPLLLFVLVAVAAAPSLRCHRSRCLLILRQHLQECH